MKIVILGTGYVGLVSGVCFSDFGHDVICVDTDQSKITALNAGIIPIYEPGLDVVMSRNVDAGRLTFSTDLKSSIADAAAIFIAVGTPSRRGDGHADLTYVYAAAKEIALNLDHHCVIVTKSTVPVGTNREIENVIKEANPNLSFDIASNPEFLREGAAVDDFMRPDRVVVGVSTDSAKAVLSDVYRPLFLRDFPIIFTDLESAELIKYASNAFLAMKVSFINEVAALCEKTGADVKSVSKGMGLDNRIGNKFLHAGPGYGGSCFPKDTNAFAKIGQDFGAPQTLTETVIEVNKTTKERMVDKIINLAGTSLKGQKVTVLGATFKPNTDDMRDAPSLSIVPALIDAGASVVIVDPHGEREGKELLKDATWLNDPYSACQGSNMVVLLTEWNEFRALDLHQIAKDMKTPLMADLRNIYTEELVLDAGFIRYTSVGR